MTTTPHDDQPVSQQRPPQWTGPPPPVGNYPPAPMPPQPPGGHRGRTIAIVAAGVVLVLGASFGAYYGENGGLGGHNKPVAPSTRTVAITVDDSSDAGSCALDNDTLTLTDQRGTVLGAASLGTGGATCQYTASIPNVPTNRTQYTLGETGVKGSATNSRSTMASNGWKFEITFS